MKVGDLTLDDFAAQLTGAGVAIRTGPFITRIVSELAEIAEPVHLLYRDFPTSTDAYADFHVRLRRAAGLTRRIRRQIVFTLDNEPAYFPQPGRLGLPLLEWGMNWCIYQHAHQYLLTHAAVVQKGGATCLIPGESGAGKSTLCAALVSRGWRLLSDELSVLRPHDLMVLPIARPISLKNESIELIKAFAPGQKFGPEFGETRKGSIVHMKPPGPSVDRMDEPSNPTHIVFPSFAAGAKADLAPVSKGRAFFRIADCSLNYPILGHDGFQCLSRVIDECDCHDLRYSSLDDAVNIFDRFQ